MAECLENSARDKGELKNLYRKQMVRNNLKGDRGNLETLVAKGDMLNVKGSK